MNDPERTGLPTHLTMPPLRARPRSRRTRQVARWFGLPSTINQPGSCDARVTELSHNLLPAGGEILLITGPSGAGKSSLLRALGGSIPTERQIDLNLLSLPEQPLVDCFGAMRLTKVLELLGFMGLGEAWTYLRTPAELSDGQRGRLRLAMALARSRRMKKGVILCDEFCAVLDRVTAAVVARALRRVVTGNNLSAIVATSHDDLQRALRPDVIVRCDFGLMRVQRVSDA